MPKPERDYSETLFLPQTEFPMRAGLPQREPEILARWEKADLYRQLRDAVGKPNEAVVECEQSDDDELQVRIVF